MLCRQEGRAPLSSMVFNSSPGGAQSVPACSGSRRGAGVDGREDSSSRSEVTEVMEDTIC